VHASVCDLLADLVQNAVEAGASQVTVEVDTDRDAVRVTVTDNGKGMDQTTMSRAMDPFYSEAGKHDWRRVGWAFPS
jgi:signal transduction histidine kinase